MKANKKTFYDIAIVGGGIIGLATAYQLSKQFKNQIKVILFEKESQIAQHQSGRNSGVIHSGVYYQPNSLRAKLCLQGHKQLIQFANEHNIEYKLSGKIIVATDDAELNGLNTIYKKGIANKIDGLKQINQQEIKSIEPNCEGLKGIWVPTAGTINYKQVCQQLKNKFIDFGGAITTNFKLKQLKHTNGLYYLSNSAQKIFAKNLICCGGAQADRLVKLEGLKPKVKIVPFKGEYYQLLKPNLVNGLIYPVPNPNFPFLGVHFTKGINGVVECGPNAVLGFHREAQKSYDFNWADNIATFSNIGFWRMGIKHFKYGWEEQVRSWSKKVFLKSLQKMIPSIDINDIVKSRFGVRAVVLKLDGSMPDDFIFEQTETSLHVLSAPSPAATASLAIGNYISKKAVTNFGLQ